MMTYIPPTHIETPDGLVNILQLTDLHLSADRQKSVAGCQCQDSFERCLSQALSENIRCDLILLTGDLVNEVDMSIYQRIFAQLSATNIAFACISGNHDVTDELYTERPFSERQFVAHAPDTRLLSHHRIMANGWQILLVDSSVPGKVHGDLPLSTQLWLTQQLTDCHLPTILVLHHHIVPVQSQWIDAHMADNAEQIWQVLRRFRQVKAVLCGHVHQESYCYHEGIHVYTTPSTCYQFKAYSDDFAFDENSRPGYRWLQLGNNGALESWVKRLDTW
ncbi:metallophosphoesterase [Psychrobacter sp. I-STPA6b]|uniref:metallophosphoesterase n=1 Tax=Psychrobacter sp. I-STPA6b TaxID=2585718 RepID=UPI001D0C2FD9|nr:metallophosphoesterase [Psychrobacter sp. I-STPA6b]